MRDARRAGIHAASALAAHQHGQRSGERGHVARLEPEEQRADEARGPQAQAQAGREAERQHHRDAAEHQHEDAEAIGAEGDPHADLGAPHIDRVGDDAVEADRRDQQGQPAEESRQHGHQALLYEAAADELIEVADREGQGGIDVVQRAGQQPISRSTGQRSTSTGSA